MNSKIHLETFLEMMAVERGSSRNTLDAYRKDLEDFIAAVKDVESADTNKISKYLSKLANDGIAPKSRARKLSAIKQFFSFLFTEKIRSDNPTTDVEAPKTGRSLPKYLAEDEVNAILNEAANNPRNKLLLELLYAAGLRVSELVSLKRNTIRQEAGQFFVFIKGKGKKERIVPLGSKAIEALDEYLHKNKITEWLFPSGNTHITRQRFGQILKEMAINANVDPEKVSPHVIRHSFASHMLDRGADLRLVQELLGHEQIATTQIYTHIQGGKLAKVVQAHHPLGK